MTMEPIIRAHLPTSAQHIVLRKSALDYMARYIQNRLWKLEAGGQLFGHLKDGTLEIKVATGPYLGDLRTRFGYRSKPDCAQREIKKQRGRGLYYCGDWHTHPQTHPTASTEDLSTISKMVQRSDFRLSCMVMVIQGTDDGAQGVAVYTSSGDAPKRWEVLDDWVRLV